MSVRQFVGCCAVAALVTIGVFDPPPPDLWTKIAFAALVLVWLCVAVSGDEAKP